MIEILNEIAKMGPVISVLIVIIYYLQKDIKAYKKEIVNLNDEIRECERENLITLHKVNAVLEKIINKDE